MFYCNIFSQFICMLCLYVFCFINFSLFECIGFHIILVVLRGKAFYVPPARCIQFFRINKICPSTVDVSLLNKSTYIYDFIFKYQ